MRAVEDFWNRLPLPDKVSARMPGRGEKVLLELDLTRGLAEAPPGNPLAALRALRTPLLRTLVEHLHRAADDDAVVGLVATVPGGGLTLAQSGELREAVAGFRTSGKPTLAFSTTFGEMTPGSVGYHLACAFDEVWLQPSGGLGLVGFAAEPAFLRGALDKLDVLPQFGQRHEYKTAADTFLRTGLTDPHREMLTELLSSLTDTLVEDVAADRDLPVEEVHDALRAAPLTAVQASSRGLVDHLGYRDQAYDALRTRIAAGSRARAPEPTPRYVERHRAGRFDGLLGSLPGPGQRPQIAVVTAAGPITLGRPTPQPGPGGGQAVGSDSLGAVLRAAGKDDHVKAVVLRIDSPGGSYVASDSLRRDVLRLRESGTAVVASMASVAASGGYFVAMPCDRVVANPGTLTGSIGVLAGKLVLAQALDRLGIHRETLASGPNAAMFSSNQPFGEEQQALLEHWLDDVYDDFTSKAAADRGLDLAHVRDVARGRVWSGADAAELGLVDILGGLGTAVREACDLVGIDRGDVAVRSWPRPHPLEVFSPPESSESVTARLSVPVPGEGPWAWQQLVGSLAEATGVRVPGVLSLPPVGLPGLLRPA